MWPEAHDAPPRPADQLLDSVLRRGHELRHAARVQRQIRWTGRAAALVAVAGLAAGLAQGTTDAGGGGRSDQVAAPAAQTDTTGAPSSTSVAAPAGTGAPDTTGPPGSSTTITADGAARRHAPLAVVEQRSADGRYRTVVLHPDGTLVPVTAATADRQMPVLSPRGDAIALQLRSPHPLTGEPRWEVFTVGTDGTGLHQVTGGVVEGGPRLVESPLGPGSRWPSWSPDGRRLAFSCSGPTGLPIICVSRADGLLRKGITKEGAGFYQPTWSPDGRTLAAKREVDGGQVELWLLQVDGDGSNPLPVPRVDPRGVRLSWSVDGAELVYAQVDSGPPGIVIVDVASGAQRFVATPTPARFPVVCGNGQVLYLESAVGLDEDSLRTGPLVLVGTDGSAPTVVLPADPAVEHLPSSCAAR